MAMSLMALLGTISVSKGNTGTRMGTFMKETGKMMSRTDWESFISKMVKSMRADSSKGKNMVRVRTHGKTETDTRGRLLMISVRVWENTTGVMVGFTKGSGRRTE